MPGRATVAASISGVAVGVAATLMITGEEPRKGATQLVLSMALRASSAVCVTVVAMVVMRQWFRANEDRTHQMANQVAQERTTFIEASGRRAQELTEREDRLTKQTEQVQGYVMDILRRLDEALTENSQVKREFAQLRARHEDLAHDHNILIHETLQERADRFTRRTNTPATRAAAMPGPPHTPAETPARPYADPTAGHAPVAPTPLRRCPAPAARLAEPMQHDRPVEVSGPA